MNPRLNLDYRSKEVLSWLVILELLKRVKDEVFVGELHPNSGQYDCLCLILPHEHPIVFLNRNGITANVQTALVEDIWSHAALDPASCAQNILDNSEISHGSMNEANYGFAKASAFMAKYLLQNAKAKPKVDWAWVDTSYEVGVNEALNEISIKDEWKELKGPSESIGWQGWIYLIFESGKLVAAVNMKTGEAIDKNGRKWVKWSQGEFDLKDNLSVPLGYEFEIKWPSERVMKLDFVSPDMKQMTYKIYSEEGCEVNFRPIFRIENTEKAQAFWSQIDNPEISSVRLKDYLG